MVLVCLRQELLALQWVVEIAKQTGKPCVIGFISVSSQ